MVTSSCLHPSVITVVGVARTPLVAPLDDANNSEISPPQVINSSDFYSRGFLSIGYITLKFMAPIGTFSLAPMPVAKISAMDNFMSSKMSIYLSFLFFVFGGAFR